MSQSQRRQGSNQLKHLPESLKACEDGWDEQDLEDEAFEVSCLWLSSHLGTTLALGHKVP